MDRLLLTTLKLPPASAEGGVVISLRKAVNSESDSFRNLQTMKDDYIETLEHLERYAPPVDGKIPQSFRESLRNLSQAIRGSSPSIVKRSSAQVGEELKQLFNGLRVLISQLQEDRQSLLRAISSAARALNSRDGKCNGIFRDFSIRVDALLAAQDMNAVRAGITREIQVLKRSVDQVLGDSKTVVSDLLTAVTAAESLAHTDSLTGLGNRRASSLLMEAKIRSGEVWCVMMFDVDRFKTINDTCGHLVGDEVLRRVAEALKENVGASGTVFRWAGDEFLAILSCNLLKAVDLDARISSHWSACTFPELGATAPTVRVSTGFCQYLKGETAEELLARADAEMYRYKRKESNSGPRD